MQKAVVYSEEKIYLRFKKKHLLAAVCTQRM